MIEAITNPGEDYDDLLARHPWIRSRDKFAYLSRGWVGLVTVMLDAMDAVMAESPSAVVTGWYTKEKFGSLRVFFQLDDAADATRLWARLREPIDSAERASHGTCEVCGAPGRLRDDRGLYATRCDAHAPGGVAPGR